MSHDSCSTRATLPVCSTARTCAAPADCARLARPPHGHADCLAQPACSLTLVSRTVRCQAGCAAEPFQSLLCLQAEELKQDADMSMPAAWRVDSYLDDDDAAGNNFAAVRSHRLQFAREPNAKDDMARKDNLDDLMVRVLWLC